MSIPVHAVAIKKGSTLPNDLSRLTLGLLLSVAIPGAVGPATGATVLNPGSGFTSVPTLVAADGSGGIFTPSMELATSSAAAAGGASSHSYAPGDTITLTGGTFAQAAVLNVEATKLVSAPAVNAAGSGYAIGDTIHGTGTGVSTEPVLTVATCGLATAALDAAGTGYQANDVLTLVGGTFTTAAQITVDTVDGSGVILTAHVTRAGAYSVLPTTFTSTGGNGTGATFKTPSWGVVTVTLTSGGSFTANPSALTQHTTSGTGTGATFNTLIFGVNTYAVQNAGSYTALPSSPISQGASSGAGTGFQLTALTWRVHTIAASGGDGYKSGSAITTSTGGGTEFSGQVVTNPIGESIPVTVSNFGLPPRFGAFIAPNGPTNWYINGKSGTGFTVMFQPLAADQPVLATAFDVWLWH